MSKPASNKFSNLLKTLLAAAGLVAVSIGATLYYLQNHHNPLAQGAAPVVVDVPTVAPVEAPAPIFLALEPFTVTLYDEHRRRVLYVAITLRLGDEVSQQILQDYMPEVRDRVLGKLSGQHPQQVQTVDGKAALVQTLREALQAPYFPNVQNPDVRGVFFTAFVVQ